MKHRGYSLVEVIIAIALLAWVSLAISGLFIYGQRGVGGGKTQTRATALCQKVYEDIRNLPNYTLKYQAFGCAQGSTTCTCTYTSTTTNPFTTGDVLYTLLEGWKTALQDLPTGATLTATLTPRLATDTTQTLTIGNNYFLQYQLNVNWVEGKRSRRVQVVFSI